MLQVEKKPINKSKNREYIVIIDFSGIYIYIYIPQQGVYICFSNSLLQMIVHLCIIIVLSSNIIIIKQKFYITVSDFTRVYWLVISLIEWTHHSGWLTCSSIYWHTNDIHTVSLATVIYHGKFLPRISQKVM